jgi:hypothetical protein
VLATPQLIYTSPKARLFPLVSLWLVLLCEVEVDHIQWLPMLVEPLHFIISCLMQPLDSCTAISRCHTRCPHQSKDPTKSSKPRTNMHLSILRIPHSQLHLPQGSRTVMSHLYFSAGRVAEISPQDEVEIIVSIRKCGNHRNDWAI